ncbi:hypothetical protein AAFF_G00405870 [Aldrovandia affinis]|uniref:Uncharacterized protein n=1 Tax=Aldrovandia affinis TaxID=143900 RepID=A0AAD7SC33_9TELE|nr:hypothetical protein AAFF_G00405870 [Aldrovandia affinis]
MRLYKSRVCENIQARRPDGHASDRCGVQARAPPVPAMEKEAPTLSPHEGPRHRSPCYWASGYSSSGGR